MSDRITWSNATIDAFDATADWFCIRAGLMKRPDEDQ